MGTPVLPGGTLFFHCALITARVQKGGSHGSLLKRYASDTGSFAYHHHRHSHSRVCIRSPRLFPQQIGGSYGSHYYIRSMLDLWSQHPRSCSGEVSHDRDEH